jgi:hypothetical protein
LNAGERLFQRQAIGQFCDRGFGIPAQHLTRFVSIANNTNRILSERAKLFHHRASGIARCSDYRNRHRCLLCLTSSVDSNVDAVRPAPPRPTVKGFRFRLSRSSSPDHLSGTGKRGARPFNLPPG